MASIQCPACRTEFEIQLDISLRTKGMTVFRGRMTFLGGLGDIEALQDFLRETFRRRPQMTKEVLIDQLAQLSGVPHSDACHLVEKLQEEGFLYERENGALGFLG